MLHSPSLGTPTNPTGTVRTPRSSARLQWPARLGCSGRLTPAQDAPLPAVPDPPTEPAQPVPSHSAPALRVPSPAGLKDRQGTSASRRGAALRRPVRREQGAQQGGAEQPGLYRAARPGAGLGGCPGAGRAGPEGTVGVGSAAAERRAVRAPPGAAGPRDGIESGGPGTELRGPAREGELRTGRP